MADGNRSRFGELVNRHRLRLGLSQSDVADRAFDLAQVDPEASPISVRTIQALEKRSSGSAGQRSPRISTVRTLAKVLELEPGTRDHEEFIAAGSGAAFEPAGVARSSEFVVEGREPHLERLREAIDGAVTGEADVVFVSGDAGAGKTWLIEEACRQALERHPNLAVLWSHSTDPAAAGSFVESHEPFRQQLRLMAGDLEIANPRQLVSDANRNQLSGRIPVAARALVTVAPGLVSRVLSDLVFWQDRIAPVVESEVVERAERVINNPALADRHGLSQCEQFFRMVARYAEAGPVVLVMDDMHWADPATVASLTHLLRRLHGQRLPVVVLGSFRPANLAPADVDSPSPFAQLVQGLPRQYPQVVLDLSTAVGGNPGRAFVDAVMQREGLAGDPALVESLYLRTGGLPLFVTGFLRLYERGDSRAAALADAVSDPTVPAEAQIVYAEQLRRLSPEIRDLLAAASVQGDTFSAEPLMRMFSLAPLQFAEMVDSRLVRQFGMLLPAGTSSVAGQTIHGYQFSHALLRDYLYHGRLNELERSQYHIATAEAMLALHGAEHHDGTDAIAYHFDQANDRERAARAYVHAGNHALAERAFARAVQRFDRAGALDIRGADPFTYVQSRVGLGNCYRGLGEPQKAREPLDRALEIAIRRNLPIARGNVLESLAMLDFDAGDMQAGVDRMNAVIDIWTDVNHHEAGRAMANLSYLLYGLGRYDDAIDFAQRGVEMAARVGDQRMWLDAQIAKTNCWLDLGLYEDAESAYRRCIEICRGLGESHREHICWVNVALVAIESSDWETFADAVSAVLDDEQEPADHLVAFAELDLGIASEARGNLSDARTHYEASRNIRERMGLGALLVDALAGLLRVAVADGDRDRARTLLDDIRSRIDVRGFDGIEHTGRMFVTLIEASEFLGDERASREYANKGIAFLSDRAHRLADPEHRESYLTNVPSHRRLLELSSDHRG